MAAVATTAADTPEAAYSAVQEQAAAVWLHVSALVPWADNPRDNEHAVPKVAASIVRFGFVAPIVVWRSANRMVAGHTRLKAVQYLLGLPTARNALGELVAGPGFVAKGAPGPGFVRVVFHDFADEREADLYAIADNRLQELAIWDEPAVNDILAKYDEQDRVLVGWDQPVKLTEDDDIDTGVAGSLQARFGVPPFSVLDSRQGYWQDRKRGWLALGIQSEVGRDGLGVTVNASEGRYEYMSGRGPATGGSVFDPVLTELLVRWFCPPGGKVLDPFAGGSVRGVVTGALGRRYHGIDLRGVQVDANRKQWADIIQRVSAGMSVQDDGLKAPKIEPVLDPDELTPVHQVGPYWLKRDDAFTVGPVCGGKTRTVYNGALRTQAGPDGLKGIISGGGKGSRRVNVVAQVAKVLGVDSAIATPTGQPTPEMQLAVAAGALRIECKPGFTKTLQAKAKKYAEERPGWCYAAFGGECLEAVEESDHQAKNLPWSDPSMKRIVVSAGSAMVLAGILRRHAAEGSKVPVIGVAVGHDPTEQLDRWAPKDWRDRCTVVVPEVPWEQPAPEEDREFLGVALDAYFEAKCRPYLQPGDLFWIVGITQAQAKGPGNTAPPRGEGGRSASVDASGWVAPHWIQGDSDYVLDDPGVCDDVDFVFTCPPYADLEVYSDDPADISGMEYPRFLRVYRSIVAKAVARLRNDRFAAIVVGDVRAPDGTYRNLVSDTIQAFLDAGARLYNDAILVTPLGSVPIRAGKTFQAGRKLGKTHQNVLVFVKGDPSKATEAVGDVDFGDDVDHD